MRSPIVEKCKTLQLATIKELLNTNQITKSAAIRMAIIKRAQKQPKITYYEILGDLELAVDPKNIWCVGNCVNKLNREQLQAYKNNKK